MTTEEFSRKLSQLIAKYRKLLGISQRRMHEETGIHIGRIESCTHCPSIKTYFKICEYFEIPLKKIMEDIDLLK